MTSSIAYKDRFRTALEAAWLPIFCTLLFIGLMMIWHALSWPSPEETVALVIEWYHRYGIWIVAFGAFIEGIAVVNLYFPGSAAIVIGVVAYHGQPLAAAGIVAIAMLGFFFAALANYAIGYYGLHALLTRIGGKPLIDRAASWYAHHGKLAVLFGYIHPNIGGIVAIACGNSRFPLGAFLAIVFISIVIWNSIWGVMSYMFSDLFRTAATSPWLICGALATWLLTRFVVAFLRPAAKEKKRTIFKD